MYIAAAWCLWFLKAWKVGQLERIAAKESEATSQVDPVEAANIPEPQGIPDPRSSYLKRMLRWRKV